MKATGNLNKKFKITLIIFILLDAIWKTLVQVFSKRISGINFMKRKTTAEE